MLLSGLTIAIECFGPMNYFTLNVNPEFSHYNGTFCYLCPLPQDWQEIFIFMFIASQ
jgi:hypothetical protein